MVETRVPGKFKAVRIMQAYYKQQNRQLLGHPGEGHNEEEDRDCVGSSATKYAELQGKTYEKQVQLEGYLAVSLNLEEYG